jgi:hypothetical protein
LDAKQIIHTTPLALTLGLLRTVASHVTLLSTLVARPSTPTTSKSAAEATTTPAAEATSTPAAEATSTPAAEATSTPTSRAVCGKMTCNEWKGSQQVQLHIGLKHVNCHTQQNLILQICHAALT